MNRSHSAVVQPLETRTFFAFGDTIDTFAADGLFRFPEAMQNVGPTDISEQADGKLLVAVNQTRSGSSSQIALIGDLVRLNPNGALDKTFGGDGIVDTFFNDIEGVTQAAGGRFYAAGTVIDPQGLVRPSWYVARFNGDGTPDRRFGNNGSVLVATKAFEKFQRPQFAHLSRDGVLTLNGVRPSNSSPPGEKFLRFLPNGQLDTAYGNGGTISGFRRAGEIADDGSMYLVERRAATQTTGEDVLRRYTPSGQLDTTFGNGGLIGSARGLGVGGAKVIGADVFVSLYSADLNRNFLVKLNTRGRTDRAFGANGIAELPERTSVSNLVRRPDGTYVSPGLLLTRLDANGAVLTDPALPYATSAFGNVYYVSRDGVLYTSTFNAITTTSLDTRGRSFATLADDGTLTILGTAADDDIQVGFGRFNGDSGTFTLTVEVNRHERSFLNTDVERVVIEGGRGDDTISVGSVNKLTLSGGAGDDAISVSGNTLGLSNSRLDGVLIGAGAGNDVIRVTGTGFVAEGGDGDDYLSASFPFGVSPSNGVPAASLYGGRGNDKLYTFSGQRGKGWALFGGAGNDYLRSSLTSDTLTGGDGVDTLLSGGGGDVFVDI